MILISSTFISPAATSVNVKIYRNNSCSGAPLESMSITPSCSAGDNGGVVTVACSATIPAIPNKPTPRPSAVPTHKPTTQGYNKGYLTITNYMDMTCSAVSSAQVFKLGSCISDQDLGDTPLVLSHYQPAQSGEASISVQSYSDAKCTVLLASNVYTVSVGCAVNTMLSYSPILPSLSSWNGVARL